jgi:hypothetical protein
MPVDPHKNVPSAIRHVPRSTQATSGQPLQIKAQSGTLLDTGIDAVAPLGGALSPGAEGLSTPGPAAGAVWRWRSIEQAPMPHLLTMSPKSGVSTQGGIDMVTAYHSAAHLSAI